MVVARRLWRRIACVLVPAAIAAVPCSAAVAFEDTMAQRTLPCTVCHGAQGRAAPDGYYPRIAGKPAGYLYNQLRNFRDGRRHYELMVGMVDLLSDGYLQEIARYFSDLELPYPPPQPVKASEAQQQRGRALVLQGDSARAIPACVECHGQAMTGTAPNVPGLLGLPRDYINAQLGAWRTGLRRTPAPDCMENIARRLDDGDVAAVSAWLASQTLPSNTRAASAVPTRASGALACASAPELGGAKP
ncbi:MAG: c-type cytochrome [Burkholderiaceae bacterium]